MALRLPWREAARADLLAIVDYISDDNPDAAQRLKARFSPKLRGWLSIRNVSVKGVCPARGNGCATQQWPPVQRPRFDARNDVA